MIKFENADVVGWEAAIRGMRNPLNSWEKSDSKQVPGMLEDEQTYIPAHFEIGPNDKDLMKRLCKAGTDHRKFMRMITMYVDITAPLYWWKEFDTYKVGTVANSCSTMHKIHAKEFTMDDFSHEHLLDFLTDYHMCDFDTNLLATITDDDITVWEDPEEKWEFEPIEVLEVTIKALNRYRELYLQTKNKVYWWQMIQLLPSSYNQKRTVQLNYEVLANMYKSRKDHKLDCWIDFCKWIKTLPFSELITGEFEEQL